MENIFKINWQNDVYCDNNEGIVKFKDTKFPLNGKYEDEYGRIQYYKNGKYHNENGPAYINTISGHKKYFINNKKHRIDGPAIIYTNGDYVWYINNYYIEKEIMNNWLKENNISLYWNTWTDSDKMMFADYWTEKYGSPHTADNEPKLEENKCYVIETKDDIFVLTGDSVSILKQILQIKKLVSIREAKINNL